MVGVKQCFVDWEVVKVFIFGCVEIEPLARFLWLALNIAKCKDAMILEMELEISCLLVASCKTPNCTSLFASHAILA